MSCLSSVKLESHQHQQHSSMFYHNNSLMNMMEMKSVPSSGNPFDHSPSVELHVPPTSSSTMNLSSCGWSQSGMSTSSTGTSGSTLAVPSNPHLLPDSTPAAQHQQPPPQLMMSMMESSGEVNRACQPPMCRGCGDWLLEPVVLRIQEHSWHEGCALCCVCGCALQQSCMERNGFLYCRYDYFRVFASVCTRCQLPLQSGVMVMRAAQSTYHLHCFTCSLCERELLPGEKFLQQPHGVLLCMEDMARAAVVSDLQQHQIFTCSAALERHLQGSTQSGGNNTNHDEEETIDTDSDSEKNSKRPRTILTASQRRRFRTAFDANPKPSRKIRECLAAETGLTVRVVQVWFQNQRAKEKKVARRQSQETNTTKNDTSHGKGGGRFAITGDKKSGVSHPQLSTSGTTAGRHPTTPGGDPQACQPISVSNTEPVEDPMDKLYSMQLNYFA